MANSDSLRRLLEVCPQWARMRLCPPRNAVKIGVATCGIGYGLAIASAANRLRRCKASDGLAGRFNDIRQDNLSTYGEKDSN
ncbi:MAG: hypothetical protein IJ087_08575, partial [Eggerthellaceae bacterium]|nr:hypothetical protein [Eggerthellaceae bacterium]